MSPSTKSSGAAQQDPAVPVTLADPGGDPRPRRGRLLRGAALLGSALIAYTVAVEVGPEHQEMPAGGQAPSFTLQDLSGRDVALGSFAGKPVLLNFWATWCPPCNVELPDLQHLATEHGGCLAVVGIALSSGDAADVAAFARARDIGYPLLLGTSAVAEAYHADGIPRSVLLDAGQQIVATWDGVIDPAEVLRAVRALKTGVASC
jgi:thiol-disulfide isomerase/thioredoxin